MGGSGSTAKEDTSLIFSAIQFYRALTSVYNNQKPSSLWNLSTISYTIKTLCFKGQMYFQPHVQT